MKRGEALGSASAAWAWPHLFERCLRESKRVLPDASDAQDAAQEAMVRIWRQQHRCARSARPEPWVAQIARREALRLFEQRRREAGRAVHDELALEHLGGPDGRLERVVDSLAFRQALSCLSRRERALALLHYDGDYSQAELARAVGAPEATVRVCLHRAREKLRAALSEAA